ncbi:hypothetical protein C8R47DRAFT_1088595 [Mycena vitilis]|nr:hypothetical protein C8R47DRAFT_1088595 [Mycena vitilis]
MPAVSKVLWGLLTVLFSVIFSTTPTQTAGHRVFWAVPRRQLEYCPSCPDDVFQVRRCLLDFLPPELVNTILDEAQYWPRIRCKSGAVTVHASTNSYHNASSRCLISPAFPTSEALGGSAARLRVKLVEIGILSHDQGWFGSPHIQGTYIGSNTWFEAAILRPGAIPKSQLEGWRGWSLALGCTRFLPERPLYEVTNSAEKSGRWRVQTNQCGSMAPKYHTISWRTDESDPTEVEKSGSGAGAGFLEALTAGDTIAIVARAMYPGWINHVRLVEIAAYYAV